MHPFVRLSLPCGKQVELVPGDLIGRSERAALCLNEPHISEAHAMVSLRSGELRLIALRGRFSVDGKAQAQVALKAGLRIVLASRKPLIVEEVGLPLTVPGVSAEGLPCTVIAPVTSLRVRPKAEVLTGFHPEADAFLWTTGTRLNARVGDDVGREVHPGDVFEVHGTAFRIHAIPIRDLTRGPTENSSEVGTPLHFIFSYDTVHIISGAHRSTIDGIGARILSELAEVRGPIAWQEVARQIWGRVGTREEVLRERWDSSLARLRRKLKDARVRDLVHATRNGHVELVLGPGDTVEDRL